MLLLGDCLEKLKELRDNSIDAIVTDPPYGLKFMNKHWDYDVPSVEIWKECFRVLKPGGHLLSFGGTRTYHRMAVNIEDAGFEIRDQIQWLYSSGFPKSMNLDRRCGIEFCGCKSNSKSQMSSLRNSSLSETVSNCQTTKSSLQSSMSEQNICKSSSRTESKESPTAGKESCLEGRGDVQTEQGELYRTEVCSVSRRIQSDGPQRQLCDGASPDNGQAFRASFESDRSCSSQRPQYSEQSNRESRTLAMQSEPQTSRTWSTCPNCRKPIIDQGWGSALKPANEPICMARKPLEKGLTIAENVIKWGTGAINIDESRIEGKPRTTHVDGNYSGKGNRQHNVFGVYGDVKLQEPTGRWPANVILDEQAAELLDEQSGLLKSGSLLTHHKRKGKAQIGTFQIRDRTGEECNFGGDSGGASRFFYVAKASKSEKNAGLENNSNNHPTVKPIKLMQYLIKLITPPQKIVLDPFMGSGTTGVAAKQLGFDFIGIELSPEYFEIAQKRIESANEV